MLKTSSFEGKNREEVKEKALNNLGLKEEELLFFFKEIEGKLFKSKKTELIVLKNDDLSDYIKKYFERLSQLIEIDIKCEIKIRENLVNIGLITSNNSLIIGKNGRTLNALQHLLKQSLNNKTVFNIKLNIDVANYKSKKNKYLEYEIKKLCQEVIKTKIDVQLDFMNSYERRIVHTIINSYKELESVSEGEEPNRFITIKHKTII